MSSKTAATSLLNVKSSTRGRGAAKTWSFATARADAPASILVRRGVSARPLVPAWPADWSAVALPITHLVKSPKVFYRTEGYYPMRNPKGRRVLPAVPPGHRPFPGPRYICGRVEAKEGHLCANT